MNKLKKLPTLEDLTENICQAIANSNRDITLIIGESFQTDGILRTIETIKILNLSACGVDRRKALCNIYADYCSRVFPLMEERQRNEHFMTIIKNHFINYADDTNNG